MNLMPEFQMPEWLKRPIVARHEFYINQARTRLLSQFENKDAEARRASEEWLSQSSHRFDPDRDDPGDFYERAYDMGIEFHQSLCEMEEQTRLSVVAGMFHNWDKELRSWMANEIRYWGRLTHFTNEIWASNFDDLIAMLAACGWDARKLPGFSNLNACRWIVNVYKHGNGKALDRLKADYPRFLLQSYAQIIDLIPDVTYRSHSDVTVTEEDIAMISDAIMEFWQAVPLNINTSIKSTAAFPKKFVKALERDLQG